MKFSAAALLAPLFLFSSGAQANKYSIGFPGQQNNRDLGSKGSGSKKSSDVEGTYYVIGWCGDERIKMKCEWGASIKRRRLGETDSDAFAKKFERMLKHSGDDEDVEVDFLDCYIHYKGYEKKKTVGWPTGWKKIVIKADSHDEVSYDQVFIFEKGVTFNFEDITITGEFAVEFVVVDGDGDGKKNDLVFDDYGIGVECPEGEVYESVDTEAPAEEVVEEATDDAADDDGPEEEGPEEKAPPNAETSDPDFRH